MKISLTWLKDYVPLNIPSEKLAHRLTMAGLEVEKIQAAAGDTILEIEVTPNRDDCLNMLGIAREMAAIFNKRMKLPRAKKMKLPTEKCAVSILDQDGCSRYVGTVVKDIRVAASPDWLQQRIQAVGLRPINNIVDITNFVLMETGQPLHAFDYDKLIGGKIIVRRARKGEQIITLDGVARTLDSSILVIADAQRPVALAGIMGGVETSVTEGTKNILLESAHFDPILIRRAARALGISTDSSYRFERNVDLQNVDKHAIRALHLIREFAVGKIAQHADIFPGKRKIVKKQVTVSKDQINSLLGTSFSTAECKTILKKLDFWVKVKDRRVLDVIAPSFRNDIHRGVDIIEEVGRIIGYDQLPSSLPCITLSNIPKSASYVLRNKIRRILLAQGLCEAITYTMIPQSSLVKTKSADLPTVRVKNPLTQEQEILRPSLLPNLLSVVRTNLNHVQKDIRLFEMGKIYLKEGEREVIALIMTGSHLQDWRTARNSLVDFYDIKGVIDSLAEKFQPEAIKFVARDKNIFSPGEGVQLMQKDKSGKERVCGQAGKLHREILKNWDIKEESVFFAEILLDGFDTSKNKTFQPLCEFPAITRDVSLAIKKDIPFQTVQDVACQFGGELLVDIKFLEQYLGEKIPAGQRGIVFSFTYQSHQRTLTEEEINKLHQQICQAFVEKLEAKIR